MKADKVADRIGKIRGKLIKQLHFLITFPVLFLIFCLLYKSTGFYYRINDDTTMRTIASGYYGAPPDGHLIFIKYLYGSFVAFLYKVLPAFDWYGILFLGLSFFCFGLLVCRISELTKNRPDKLAIRILCFLILFTIFFDSVILFQFTTTAGTTAVTALFLLITYDRKKGARGYVLIWILYLITALIRMNVFLMTLPAFSLIAMYQLFKLTGKGIRQQKKRMHRLKPVLPFIIITIISLCLFRGIHLVEDYAYSDEKWKTYNEFLHYRSLIYDYYGWPPYEGNEKFWTDLDITREEHACMYSNMFGILTGSDAPKLKKIAKLGSDISKTAGIRDRLCKMWNLFTVIVKSAGCREQNILLLAGLILFLLCPARKDRAEQLAICGFLLAQLIVLCYLLYRGRLPDRVLIIYDYQIILGITGLILTRIREEKTVIRESVLRRITESCILAVVPLVLFVISNTDETVRSYNVSLGIYEDYAEYLSREPDNVYVCCTGIVTTRRKFTLHDRPETFNVFGTMGWSCKSPYVEKHMERLGLDPDEDILLEDGTYFVTPDLSKADLLDTYFRSRQKSYDGYEVADMIRFPEREGDIYVVRWR